MTKKCSFRYKVNYPRPLVLARTHICQQIYVKSKYHFNFYHVHEILMYLVIPRIGIGGSTKLASRLYITVKFL